MLEINFIVDGRREEVEREGGREGGGVILSYFPQLDGDDMSLRRFSTQTNNRRSCRHPTIHSFTPPPHELLHSCTALSRLLLLLHGPSLPTSSLLHKEARAMIDHVRNFQKNSKKRSINNTITAARPV